MRTSEYSSLAAPTCRFPEGVPELDIFIRAELVCIGGLVRGCLWMFTCGSSEAVELCDHLSTYYGKGTFVYFTQTSFQMYVCLINVNIY